MRRPNRLRNGSLWSSASDCSRAASLQFGDRSGNPPKRVFTRLASQCIMISAGEPRTPGPVVLPHRGTRSARRPHLCRRDGGNLTTLFNFVRSDGKTGVLGVSDAPGSLVILYLQALYNALSGLGG